MDVEQPRTTEIQALVENDESAVVSPLLSPSKVVCAQPFPETPRLDVVVPNTAKINPGEESEELDIREAGNSEKSSISPPGKSTVNPLETEVSSNRRKSKYVKKSRTTRDDSILNVNSASKGDKKRKYKRRTQSTGNLADLKADLLDIAPILEPKQSLGNDGADIPKNSQDQMETSLPEPKIERKGSTASSRPRAGRKSLPTKSSTHNLPLQAKLVKVDSNAPAPSTKIIPKTQLSGIKNVFEEIIAHGENNKDSIEQDETSFESLELSTKIGGNWRPNNWRYTTAESPDFSKQKMIHELVTVEGRLTRTKFKQLAPPKPEVVEYAPVFEVQEDQVLLQPSKFEIVRFLPITRTVNKKDGCMFNVISEYDDILTNLFVDAVYLNFTTHKLKGDFEEKCKYC